jgi:large subunit ribosomal protein L23
MKNSSIIKPLITEKSMKDAALGRYTFAVAKSANKAKIVEDVIKMFKVTPVNIKTIVVKGKNVMNRKNREMNLEQNWKKAIVELAKGQKIDLFDTNA